MKFKCLQPNLDRGLSIVHRAATSRPTRPVLSHVRLEADAEHPLVRLSCTDLELRIDCAVAAKIETPGAYTVLARLVADLTKALPPERVDVELQDSALHLACAQTEAHVKGIPADEYPTAPRIYRKPDPVAAWQPGDMVAAIRLVTFAAADDESRPILTGILLQVEQVEDRSVLTLASADGFRLAALHVPLQTQVPDIKVVLPASALVELARMLPDEREDAEMYLDDNQAWFHLAGNAGKNEGRIYGIDLVTQLLQGNFVNYRQIIPQSHNSRALVEREALVRALKMAKLYAKNNAGAVTLGIGANKLIVKAESVTYGTYRAELPADVEGDYHLINFNIDYLLDPLQALDCARVAIETNGPARPGVIRPEDGSDYVCVVMPMHMRE